MSQAAWRSHFTFNKYTQICARATRQALKEEERLKSTKRGELSLRYQEWKQGVAGEQNQLGAAKK